MPGRDHAIAERIARETDSDEAVVLAWFADVRHVVDGLVSEGYSVLIPPLIAGSVNDPVLDRLLFMAKVPQFELPWAFDSSVEELTEKLRLPLDLVENYPMVGIAGISARVLDDLRGIQESELADGELDARGEWIEAWADQYGAAGGGGPPIRCSRSAWSQTSRSGSRPISKFCTTWATTCGPRR